MTTPGPAVVSFRRLRLSLGVVAVVSGIGAAAAVIGAASFPRGHFDWALTGIGLFGLTAVAWLVWGILALAVRRFDAALLVPPVLLALAIGVGQADLPLRVRFAAARPAFENAVAARGEAGPGAPCPSRIGTYSVAQCVTDGWITRFYAGGGFLDAVGFAYAPDGVPAETVGDGSVDYDILTGPWYTFSQGW